MLTIILAKVLLATSILQKGNPRHRKLWFLPKVTRKLGFRFRCCSVRAHISDHSRFLLFVFVFQASFIPSRDYAL